MEVEDGAGDDEGESGVDGGSDGDDEGDGDAPRDPTDSQDFVSIVESIWAKRRASLLHDYAIAAMYFDPTPEILVRAKASSAEEDAALDRIATKQCAKPPDLARLYIGELGRCTSGAVVRRVSGGGCTSGVVVRRVSGGVQAGWLYVELVVVYKRGGCTPS